MAEITAAVVDDMTQEFTTATTDFLNLDLNQFETDIKQAYDDLNTIAPNGSIIYKATSTSQILKNAYKLIMTAREFFTGQIITYRIYYASNSKASSFNNNVKVYNLTEEQILDLASREGNALRLRNSFTRALKNTEQNTQREAIFDKHWGDIAAGLAEVFWKKQTLYRVHKIIFETYASVNSGLRNKRNPNQYNMFNRGNLYEAFEATSTDIYGEAPVGEKTPKIKLQAFKDTYFRKYLKHDSVKGFATGDVDLVQVKARHAQIMEVATLKTYLKELIAIFEAIRTDTASQRKLYNKIKELFTDPEKSRIDSAVKQHIDESIDMLARSLK